MWTQILQTDNSPLCGGCLCWGRLLALTLPGLSTESLNSRQKEIRLVQQRNIQLATSTGHERELLVHVDTFIDLPSPQVLVVLFHSTWSLPHAHPPPTHAFVNPLSEITFIPFHMCGKWVNYETHLDPWKCEDIIAFWIDLLMETM